MMNHARRQLEPALVHVVGVAAVHVVEVGADHVDVEGLVDEVAKYGIFAQCLFISCSLQNSSSYSVVFSTIVVDFSMLLFVYYTCLRSPIIIGVFYNNKFSLFFIKCTLYRLPLFIGKFHFWYVGGMLGVNVGLQELGTTVLSQPEIGQSMPIAE
ncbi:hypothetical protein DICVIV_03044 [Dictyocaulus viviparus]|uniref:Uncharacterized protein n=1 Tax=Dictyocaulus viviparus TaxID=29172 RepID=A0A0D8Y276_DICVI|nr:hypothetical protein DICVIV_03044 [Dictyocaulus viviparus]